MDLHMNPTLSLPTRRALSRLGRDISQARRRHRLSCADLAAQMGVSLSTVRRLERGAPGVALHALLDALRVLGLLGDFSALFETRNDAIGLIVQDEHLPKRVRRTHDRQGDA